MYNLPNILTISRIAVIPLIFISIYIHSFAWAMFAGIMFVAASITDYLDGYLARAWNETSVQNAENGAERRKSAKLLWKTLLLRYSEKGNLITYDKITETF